MTSVLNPNDIMNKKRNIDGDYLNTLADVSHVPSELRYGYLPQNNENVNNGNKKIKTKHELDAEMHYAKQDIINREMTKKNIVENRYLSPTSGSLVRPVQHYYDFSNPVKNTYRRGSGLAGHPELYSDDGVAIQPTYKPHYGKKPTDKEWEEEIPHFAGKKKRKTNRKSLNKRKKTKKRRKNKRKSVKNRKRNK